jgi:hypothetical protein
MLGCAIPAKYPLSQPGCEHLGREASGFSNGCAGRLPGSEAEISVVGCRDRRPTQIPAESAFTRLTTGSHRETGDVDRNNPHSSCRYASLQEAVGANLAGVHPPARRSLRGTEASTASILAQRHANRSAVPHHRIGGPATPSSPQARGSPHPSRRDRVPSKEEIHVVTGPHLCQTKANRSMRLSPRPEGTIIRFFRGQQKPSTEEGMTGRTQ